MRTLALILSCICTGIIVTGILLKIAHVPGGGLLTILGTGLFLVPTLPLLAIYRARTAPTGLGKAAAVVGLFAGWIMGTGLLFAIQRWPGAMINWMVGVTLLLVFVVLYAIALANPAYKGKRFGIFDVLLIIVLGTMIVGRQFAMSSGEATKQKMAGYENLMKQEMEVHAQIEDQKDQLFAGTDDSAMIVNVVQLDDATRKLVDFITEVKTELIAHDAGMPLGVLSGLPDSTLLKTIDHPNDYDLTTHYMIGEDPSYVSGKARELKKMLVEYQTSTLHPDLGNKIDVHDVKVNGKFVSWERGNFYHTPLIDALGILTQLQIDILEAEKQAIEQHKFITR